MGTVGWWEEEKETQSEEEKEEEEGQKGGRKGKRGKEDNIVCSVFQRVLQNQP